MRIWRKAAFAFCVAIFTAGAQAAPACGEVRLGFGLSKPPYIMESDKDGLEIEIAEQALTASGCTMIAMHFPPTRGLGMLKTGQIHGLMTTDEGIGSDYYFSDSYIAYQNVATTLTSRHIELHSMDDLSNYSVAGFQNASVILGPRFNALVPHIKDYKEYPYQLIQDNLLYTGRVDVAVGDRLIFRYFSKHMMSSIDGNQPVTFHSIFPPNPRKVAFRSVELRDRFNAGLKIIRGNGTYDAILRKYQQFMQP